MKHISDKEIKYYLKTVVADGVLFICLFTQHNRMSHSKVTQFSPLSYHSFLD